MDNRTSPVYEFGSFRLDTKRRVLLKDESQVTLSSKAYDALLVLVSNSGRLVKKEELLSSVPFRTSGSLATAPRNAPRRKTLAAYLHRAARAAGSFVSWLSKPKVASRVHSSSWC